MLEALTFVISMMGSSIQSCIGFGSAVFVMNFFPNMFSYNMAVSLSNVISVVLTASIIIRCHKNIRWKVYFCMIIPAFITNILATNYSLGVDTSKMKLALGILFIVLSIYFPFVSKKIRLEAKYWVGMVAGAFSGLCTGFFGIGGPMAVLYLVPALPDKKDYLATTQMYFFTNAIVSLWVRLSSGSMATSDIPAISVAAIGGFLGTFIGYWAASKIKADVLRNIIYAFIGINGALIVINYFV